MSDGSYRVKDAMEKKYKTLKGGGQYPFNVQIWKRMSSSEKWAYTGQGKFFKTESEAKKYIKSKP